MRRRWGSRDSWTIVLGDDRSVDFAVWVLEVDGLRVRPFATHGEGTGELRALGLDADAWRAWVAALTAPTRRAPTGNPVDLWRGDSSVSQRLHDLWQAYGLISNDRAVEHPIMERPYVKMTSHLWRDLKPWHRHIPPPLTVTYVHYAAAVEYLLPPATAILGFPSTLPEPQALRDQIVGVAGHLSA